MSRSKVRPSPIRTLEGCSHRLICVFQIPWAPPSITLIRHRDMLRRLTCPMLPAIYQRLFPSRHYKLVGAAWFRTQRLHRDILVNRRCSLQMQLRTPFIMRRSLETPRHALCHELYGAAPRQLAHAPSANTHPAAFPAQSFAESAMPAAM